MCISVRSTILATVCCAAALAGCGGVLWICAALSAAGAFGMLALCAFPRAVSPAPAPGG